MASTAPAKSQPLHNFDMPSRLKWKTDGSSSGQNQRRRTMKSPLRRPNPSVTSPLPQSPLSDSVPPSSSRRQSPPRPQQSSRESPVPGDSSVKLSQIRRESSQPPPVCERVKLPPAGDDSPRHLADKGESARRWLSRVSAMESEGSKNREAPLIEYRRSHSKHSAAAGSSKNGVNSKHPEKSSGEKLDKKPKATEAGPSTIKKSKILIRIPRKINKPEAKTRSEEPPQKIPEPPKKTGEKTPSEDELEEAKLLFSLDDEGKTWNLRPRKPIRKSSNVNGGAGKTNGGAVKINGGSGKNNASAPPEKKNKAPSSSKNANSKAGETEANDGGSGEKKEKEKEKEKEKDKKKLSISISLTKEEIEEDIFALTGGKPSRRPKKRPKNVQKQLDYVFPGLWLQGISADSYKVSETSLKG